MKRTPPALLLLAAWVAVLAGLSWYVNSRLVIGTDLRLFMPSPTTAQQRLLLDEIGAGAASRVLVIALAGAPPEMLADASRSLVASLQDSRHFQLISNGEQSLEVIPEELLPYRFMLSTTLDSRPLDAAYLHEELLARARDLASPAGTFLEPWLPRDPTLELLKVLQGLQPMQQPNRLYDVWFDRAGQRALLIAQAKAAAFDPQQQRIALEELNQAFAALNAEGAMQMMVSGTGKFSVLMEQRTRGEAQLLGVVASAGMVLLLLIAYRRFDHVVLSALPLASAGVAGLAAVSGLYDAVHGITLAFGFTLIGVAQDYPMHLLSHEHAGGSPLQSVRKLWPTLATGVASTCIAYLTFFFSGVIGLAQLACFTVAALAVAGLTTRFLLPRLMATGTRDYGEWKFLERLWNSITALPQPRWLAPLAISACIAAIALAPQPLWENDLSKLTPVPRELLEQDQALRSQLGTPDVRYLLVVEAADNEQALARLQSLDQPLQALLDQGAVAGYDHVARYLPSTARQRARQQRLPDTPTLRAALDSALVDTPFRADVFEPFMEDVAAARALPALTFQQLQASALGAGMQMLLMQREQKVTALVTFTGVKEPAALRAMAAKLGSDATLLDLKEASETLIARQRTRILWSLMIASILLTGVVAIALRNAGRVVRVLAPMLLTTLLVLAILRASGVSLSLFHLIALVLVAGLGLDYALFFEHAADDALEQRRTLHAILVCSLSTTMVFALLATSSLPVLRAIGVTVTLGVISNFVLALLLTRPRAAAA